MTERLASIHLMLIEKFNVGCRNLVNGSLTALRDHCSNYYQRDSFFVKISVSVSRLLFSLFFRLEKMLSFCFSVFPFQFS